MNLIETAKEQMCDKNMIQGYYQEVHDPGAFLNAEKALMEIPITQLPDYRVVKPILELRDLVMRVERLAGYIAEGEHNGRYDYLEGIDNLRELHRQANIHTSQVEEAVREIRD